MKNKKARDAGNVNGPESQGTKDTMSVNHFAPQSKAPNLRRVLLVRGGEEVYVCVDAITEAERQELHERALFPLARRRFGARLRSARRAENRVLLAQLAALEVAQ